MRRSGQRRRGSLAALALVLVATALGACDPDGPVGRSAIDRETFVATYVDLREAALTSAGGTIDPADREAILARHGVTEEELLRFAEVHGRDVEYMQQVWSEVEKRLAGSGAPADSAS